MNKENRSLKIMQFFSDEHVIIITQGLIIKVESVF
jgi:hypothetical protein